MSPRHGWGMCPRCKMFAFIGHGPLCGDCYDYAIRSARLDDIERDIDDPSPLALAAVFAVAALAIGLAVAAGMWFGLARHG